MILWQPRLRARRFHASRRAARGRCLAVILALASGGGLAVTAAAQDLSREQMIFLTAEWQGQRFPDGRPKTPDSILERMKKVSIEEAWSVLQSAGYRNQFVGGWKMIHQDRPLVGRAVTAQYMPLRPELQQRMLERGHQNGRVGAMNSWPIDTLRPGDVYVADAFGKVADGTLIGDNLGNSIFAKSHNGVIFDGSLRDLEGLEEIEGFNAYVRDWHPSAIKEMMLMGLNTPVRIGEATVLPGDVVLAKREGVIFIPAHLAEKVADRAEEVMLRDQFGHLRLREGKYTPGQIDTKWTPDIERDFIQWLKDNANQADAPRETIERLLKTRNP